MSYFVHSLPCGRVGRHLDYRPATGIQGCNSGVRGYDAEEFQLV